MPDSSREFAPRLVEAVGCSRKHRIGIVNGKTRLEAPIAARLAKVIHAVR